MKRQDLPAFKFFKLKTSNIMKLDVFRIRQGRFLTQNRWVLCFTVIALALSCMTVNTYVCTRGSCSQPQKQSVHGKVTDEAGKPLQGVSVTVKGSTKGVATNERGEYQYRHF